MKEATSCVIVKPMNPLMFSDLDYLASNSSRIVYLALDGTMQWTVDVTLAGDTKLVMAIEDSFLLFVGIIGFQLETGDIFHHYGSPLKDE